MQFVSVYGGGAGISLVSGSCDIETVLIASVYGGGAEKIQQQYRGIRFETAQTHNSTACTCHFFNLVVEIAHPCHKCLPAARSQW